MISNLNSFIPNLDELKRRAEPHVDGRPGAEALFVATGELRNAGYRDDNPKLFEVVRDYFAAELEHRNRRGLFLSGPAGIGKTFGIMVMAARFGWPVIPAQTFEEVWLSGETTAGWDAFVQGQDFFGKPRMIVIDDLGTENCPVCRFGTSCNLLAEVLDTRYRVSFLRSGIRTIVTTNFNDEQLRSRYGYRIDDRLNEMFQFAAVGGKSLRG